jgi:hypothetical protein
MMRAMHAVRYNQPMHRALMRASVPKHFDARLRRTQWN